MIENENDAKKVFRKLGTCSRTLFFILNRKFGYQKEIEERAADPLAGGIFQEGYQCGMLWGAALAVGAESFRRNKNHDQAVGIAIKTTQGVIESFVRRTKSPDCYDITDCDFKNKLSMAKYLITCKFLSCFTLAEDWAPEAIQSAKQGLDNEYTDLPQNAISCASEVAKKMGASDEEIIMVAGFAGGLGLSGNACGALSASIWMKNLDRCRKNIKTSFKDPEAEKTLETFYEATNFKILCSEITGECFNCIEDHTEFIKNGGCDKLINVLANS